MPSRRRKLDAVVAKLQLDYGPRAIRRAGPAERTPAVPRIPTSFAALDAALGGGLPLGRLTEISGATTAGKLTLAAKVIAAAHRLDRETLAGWIDASGTGDPDYFSRCGMDLARLLVVRPRSTVDALAIALHLVETRALAVLVCDVLPDAAAPAIAADIAGALARLNLLLPETATAAICLTEPAPANPVLAHAAAVRIVLRREEWFTRAGDVRGYAGQAEIAKNRLGPAGARVPIRILFNGTVRGDGL